MTVYSNKYPLVVTNGVPQPLELNSPIPGYTNWKAVVVSNYSPYIATLIGVGDTAANFPSLQPFIANKFSFTNVRGAIEVQWTNPLTQPSQINPFVTVDFSDEPDVDFTGSYPLSLPVSAATSQPVVPTEGMPLEVYQVGGLSSSGPISCPGSSGGTNTEVIPAPTKAYRLHRGIWQAPATATGQAELLDGFTIIDGFYLPNAVANSDFDGLTVQDAVTVTNFGSATLSFTLRYDEIAVPSLI